MVKIKALSATLLAPLPAPDGSSLEEKTNTFLATLDPKDILDVLTESTSTGKYGLTTTHFSTIVYRA